MLKKLLSKKGFTLVELMVVVAIIGILSAVAVPNFKKYQAKSKTSEAKLQLTAMYTALQSFQSDYDTYASCLSNMGYDPSGEKAQRYYTTGFGAGETAQSTVASTRGAAACVGNATPADGTHKFVATKYPSGVSAQPSTPSGTVAATASTFTVGAAGSIENNATKLDNWTINDSKLVIQTSQGY